MERARHEAGLSHRQLAAATGIHPSSINRLLKDEIDEPSPDNLVRLATVLELNTVEVFTVAGLPVPTELPSIEALLRTEYPDLPDTAIAEVRRDIDVIVSKYNAERHRNNS